MPSWWDSLFGDVPMPQHPQSRNPLREAYPMMPPMKASVEDRTQQDPYGDYKGWMKAGPSSLESRAAVTQYVPPEVWKDQRIAWSDPMLEAGPTLSQGAIDDQSFDPYKPSYPNNAKIRPRPGVAAYRPSPVGRDEYGDETGLMGPTLPRGPVGASRDPEMPYMGAHLPIAPGDPHWTPPPSPSGPHARNPEFSDEPRPGYGSPVMPMDIRGLTLNANPWSY